MFAGAVATSSDVTTASADTRDRGAAFDVSVCFGGRLDLPSGKRRMSAADPKCRKKKYEE